MLPLVTLDPSIITTETAKAVVNELKRKKGKRKIKEEGKRRKWRSLGPLENDGRS